MTCIQGNLRDTGTQYEVQRERLKAATPQGQSTDTCIGDGLLRSSEEIAVMAMERREQLIKVKMY